MDIKKAKEELQQVFLIKKNINTLEEKLLEINTMIKGGYIVYNERVQTSGAGGKESLICKAVDLQYKINDLIKEKLILTETIMTNIYKINDNVFEIILKMRYIDCCSWEKIAVEIGYTVRQIHRLHGKALEKYANISRK